MKTSLEFSKKLKEAECELESEYMWVKYTMWKKPKIWLSDIAKDISNIKLTCLSGKREYEYPAYDILNDICVRFCKEFWGEIFIEVGESSGWNKKKRAYIFHSEIILFLLQQSKPQKEIEDYIWENCKFKNQKYEPKK